MWGKFGLRDETEDVGYYFCSASTLLNRLFLIATDTADYIKILVC